MIGGNLNAEKLRENSKTSASLKFKKKDQNLLSKMKTLAPVHPELEFLRDFKDSKDQLRMTNITVFLTRNKCQLRNWM